MHTLPLYVYCTYLVKCVNCSSIYFYTPPNIPLELNAVEINLEFYHLIIVVVADGTNAKLRVADNAIYWWAYCWLKDMKPWNLFLEFRIKRTDLR